MTPKMEDQHKSDEQAAGSAHDNLQQVNRIIQIAVLIIVAVACCGIFSLIWDVPW